MWKSCDPSIIILSVTSGKVYGGSKRVIKKSNNCQNSDVEYEMELDLSNRKFVINSEKIVVEAKIGHFHYSPIVIFSYADNKIDLL